ncbi:MAG: DUF5717 family protein [Eubacteriales bacterium]|nr:DUF5717 family protein [Eubacteriales bacterium]
MKDKIGRLAKGIIDDELPEIVFRDSEINGMVYPGRINSFATTIESTNGRSLKGVCYCDDWRVKIPNPAFLGRIANIAFTFDAVSLKEGEVSKGEIKLVTNAGEYSIPYYFNVGKPIEKAGVRTSFTSDNSKSETAESEPKKEKDSKTVEAMKEAVRERNTLCSHIPNDENLLFDAATMLIKEGAKGDVALAIYKEAIKRDIRITHIFESYMEAFPENSTEKMPQEVLLYYSYEREPDLRTADKLYANIVRYVSRDSDLYLDYEPRIADFAIRNALNKRINSNLAVIYDRFLDVGMIDSKLARVLPDIIKTCKIKIDDDRVKSVHVSYPGLKNITAVNVKDGMVYVPVFRKDATISFFDAYRNEIEVTNGVSVKRLMERPDLLKRCFEIDNSHTVLLYSAVREILTKSEFNDTDRKLLISALSDLSMEDELKSSVIKTLCRIGGDAAWIDGCSLNEMDTDTGKYAFKAYLDSGKYEEAYLYIRSAGPDAIGQSELQRLVASLLSKNMKPVQADGEPDRFFVMLCKKLFDEGYGTPQIVDLLAQVYEGTSGDMFDVLSAAVRNRLPVYDLPERALMTMLFANVKEHIDDVFIAYAGSENYKETLLKAFFVRRMTDYFEFEEKGVKEEIFEALASYEGSVRYREGLPDIIHIGLTYYFSTKEVLSAKEMDLCQALTDLLISKGLIFRYTKSLRKKIRIPRAVCERFFVEYHSMVNHDRESQPVMTARILPDEKEFKPVNLKRVYRSVYVASTVLFMGDEMQYRIFDSEYGEGAASEGIIRVTKLHGRDNDRYAQLNRMTNALKNSDAEGLRNMMMSYAVDDEINKELFRLD